MDEKMKTLSIYRFNKAKDCLKLANQLLAEGELSAAQNRTYYALFNGIRAITILDGFDSSKHSGIISHFNQFYVKNGLFKPDTSKTIRAASMLREKSDYEDFYEPDEKETKETIALVDGFLNDVEDYLKNNGVLI